MSGRPSPAAASWVRRWRWPPLLVALLQTADSLPIFLLALPAGALADVVDRRRLLLFTQVWLGLAAATLGVLTLLGLTTPVVLLAATLLVGYVLAKLLRLHAGWLGGRWAKRVGARITRDIAQRIADELLVPLEQFDASRAALGKAVRTADDCS